MKDITGLNGKIENEGVSGKGRLSAEEFNLLVDAAIEMQEKITDYFTPISEDDYEALMTEEKLEDRPYFVYEE
jgi:hypothetical protein